VKEAGENLHRFIKVEERENGRSPLYCGLQPPHCKSNQKIAIDRLKGKKRKKKMEHLYQIFLPL